MDVELPRVRAQTPMKSPNHLAWPASRRTRAQESAQRGAQKDERPEGHRRGTDAARSARHETRVCQATPVASCRARGGPAQAPRGPPPHSPLGFTVSPRVPGPRSSDDRCRSLSHTACVRMGRKQAKQTSPDVSSENSGGVSTGPHEGLAESAPLGKVWGVGRGQSGRRELAGDTAGGGMSSGLPSRGEDTAHEGPGARLGLGKSSKWPEGHDAEQSGNKAN